MGAVQFNVDRASDTVVEEWIKLGKKEKEGKEKSSKKEKKAKERGDILIRHQFQSYATITKVLPRPPPTLR